MLPRSIQFPAHYFTLLTDNLQFEKAALLLPDHDSGFYVPWAAAGFDTTTLHRMRVSTEDAQELLSRSPAGYVWQGDDLARIAPYLSRRETTTIRQVLVFPIGNSEATDALLIVAASPYLESGQEFLRVILAAIAEPSARAIAHNRSRVTRRLASAVVFKLEDIETIADRITSRVDQPIIVAALEIGDAISQISTTNAHIDRFRVRRDILQIVASLFATTASTIDAGTQKALLLIHSDAVEDVELIAHHISASLHHLMPELLSPPALRVQHDTYPCKDVPLASLARQILQSQ